MGTADEDHSSIKQTNRFEMRLNSIRQKSNSIWKQYSITYSNILIRYPWVILVVSALLTAGLTGCFFAFMHLRAFDQTDFLMNNGESMRNARRLRQIFGKDTELRVHQQLHLYPALDIIIRRKVKAGEINDSRTNMLDSHILREVHLLHQQIQSVRLPYSHDSREYNYSSLCTKLNGACMIDGDYILTKTFNQTLSNLHVSKGGYFLDDTGANGIPAFMFGKKFQLINDTPIVSDYEEVEELASDDLFTATEAAAVETPLLQTFSYVPLFRLRYSLNSSTGELRQLAIDWEREALRYLNQQYQSALIELSISTSTAITDSVEKKAHEEGFFMSIMLLIFFILFCVSLSVQGNILTSLGFLPICGIISIALSTGATFGLLSICRIQIIEPMAFLVFLVAIVDCMRCSILCGEYHRVIQEYFATTPSISSKIYLEHILPLIIESTHPYFLTSTLLISVVYLIFAAISPMSSTILICFTLVLYIVVNYIVHSTFFSSCLAITLRRISARRHCLSFHRLSIDYTQTKSTSSIFKEFYNKCQPRFNIDSIFKTFISGTLCLLSIVCMIFSLWFSLSIDTRLFDDEFLPRDVNSLRSHMKSQVEDFDIGPMIIFTIPEPIDYDNEQTKASIASLLKQCRNEPRTNTFHLLWLEFENIPTITKPSNESLEFRITPFSRHELIVSENKNQPTIIASRFYCQYKSIQGDREDIRTMHNIYTYARQSSLPSVFPYSLIFPNYESLEQIRIEMYVLMILLIICGFMITYLPFISWKISISIAFHLLLLFTCTLACLYQFHNLTFNFANALWLPVIPILFIEALIHTAYFSTNSKWKYNRVILSLMISLIVLYVYPIQSYVFLIIRNSLMYQSIICLVLINLIFPSLHHLLFKVSGSEKISTPFQSAATMPDTNQSLTNEVEVIEVIYDSKRPANSSI